MLIAWMLAGSSGTLIAGYFKPDWPERTLFGQKIWFQVWSMFLWLLLNTYSCFNTFSFLHISCVISFS